MEVVGAQSCWLLGVELRRGVIWLIDGWGLLRVSGCRGGVAKVGDLMSLYATGKNR